MQQVKYDGLQRTFSKEYSNILKQAIKKGKIDGYLEDDFSYEDKDNHIYRLQGLMHPNVVLDPEKNDFENAKVFYEAYKDLSPLIASEEAFWAYLTHVEHYEYVKKRWFSDVAPSETTIQRRFFYSGSVMDNALSRLWWTVHLTIKEGENPYEYTEILLKDGNSDLLQNFSKSKLLRHANAAHGILRFFKEYNDRTNFSEVNRFIIQYFNRLSGVKQLIYMDEDYFYETAKSALAFYKSKQQ